MNWEVIPDAIPDQMKFLYSIPILLVLLLARVADASAAVRDAGLRQSREVLTEDPEPKSLHYLLRLPEGYAKDSDKDWPLILFLHGAGERGDDLGKVAIHGPPQLVSAKPRVPKKESVEQKAGRMESIELLSKEFIIVSPQCPAGTSWLASELSGLLDSVGSRLSVDKKRIYLTGLSMGGYGTWDLGLREPERFAAIAPICGGGDSIIARLNRRHKTRGVRQKQIPVWCFHGGKDGTVPVEESERMVNLLKGFGNDSTRLTVYPEASHDSWTASYANPELYRWFLSHSLP
ncbi:MAG: putative peptidase [Limisphaerales bacterium]